MMKKIFSIALIAFGFGSVATAQHNHEFCGNNIHKLKESHPGLEQSIDEYNKAFIEYKAGLPKGELRDDGVRIIPVVVHIIHEGGTENIPDSRVQEMIDILNLDFRKQTDVFRIPPRFDSIAVDSKIEFRLAQKDPQGNCTDGIRRIYSYKTNQATNASGFKGLSYWNRNEYFNIWIVRTIASQPPFTTLGYAQFPFSFFGTPPRTSTDGIAMAFGAVGNAAGTNKFVTAHEVGHWLGLFHTWGDADCGDDQVDDTPIQRGQNFGWWCGDPLTVKQATCYENFLTSKQDSIMRFIIGENYQNYMDYGDCKVMFTRGQLDRMNFTLTNIPFRANLITEANILKTGTNDDFTCERLPIPEFWTQNNMVCVGDNVTLTNGTFNGIADSYLWEMPGASPSTSTDVNPTVTYAQSGVYSVTLKAIKNGQEFSKVRTELVYVMPQQAESKFWGYLEGFEDGNLLNLGGPWMNINLDRNSNRWEITADAAFTGVASLRMKNENSTRGEIDRLITPPFDISAIPNSGAAKVLEFKYAYARKTNQEGVFNPASGSFEEVLNDELKVFFSTNCGKTWLERTTLTGNALVTAGLVAGGFVPQSKDQWRTLELTIPATFANATNLQVMFEWKAGSAFGNDFYLDDFRIWDKNSTGIAEDIDNAIGLNIYPNPSNDFVKVNFTLPESISKADIILTDMAGRLVSGIYSGALNQGEHTYTIERSQVRNSGLYFLKINLGGREIVKKVMFN